MYLTSLLSWIGNDHTAIGTCPSGTRYTIEFDGQTYWLEVDNDILMDLHTTMDDAKEAAETLACLSYRHLTPVDVINSRLTGACMA